MSITTINQLWEKQKAFWKWENEHFFGVTPLDNWNNIEQANEHLKKCADQFWNHGTNELKKLFEEGERCKDIDKMVPHSYELVYDENEIICLYATFQWYQDVKHSDKPELMTKRSPLAYLPVPDDLCWFLSESRYVLRITAWSQYGLVYRRGDTVHYQKAWTFDVNSKEFAVNPRMDEDFEPYGSLTDLNRRYLSALAGVKPDSLTRELFVETLCKLPEHDSRSIYNFRFTHVDGMFDLIRNSKRFANPLMKVPIPVNVVKMFTAQRIRNDANDKNGSNNLVLANNELFALENCRTVIYKNEFNTGFMFTNVERFFDAFKTSTNKSAGKSRLILDTTEVKDGLLWTELFDENGQALGLVDMWTAMCHPEWTVKKNLSVLSSSNFGNNNAPKRIMMTAKLRAQAVKTAGEADPFTHETPARIVFGDWKGFNFGDSIVISRSFARKLRSVKRRKIHVQNRDLYREIVMKYNVGDQMSVLDLQELMGSTMCNNFRNIMVEGIGDSFISVVADVPFSVGDKLTNLHGSKGICSVILEDDQMPYLKNDIGDFKAGPFEVIVSGLSVYRRKSLGQLFEAWAKASGHDDVDDIIDAVARYADEMKAFSEQSVVVFEGQETIKPCGINSILRLDHDAVGKQSHSYVKSNYARMLKFGEMELLNLASRGLFSIMNEIDVRSISKHHNSIQQIRDMQKTGTIHSEPANSLRFFNLLRTAGFDFNLRTVSAEALSPQWADKQNLLTDDTIELFGDEEM